MKVPLSHYVQFWVVNSFMALGTGYIMGLVTSRATLIISKGPISDLVVLTFPFLFVFIYQFIFASFFWGKRRGEFEYSFLERSVERGKFNPEIGIRLKEIKQELRLGDPNAAYMKLIAAAKTFPDNFVIKFKYALSCEWVGQAEKAIEGYKAAETLLPEETEALHLYIKKQIDRVERYGPTNQSSAPGLQYLIY